jgi:predicted DNA-binding protein
MTMSGGNKEERVVYPLIAFRPNPKLEKRLRRAAKKAGIPMSQIIRISLMRHLPELEKDFHDE